MKELFILMAVLLEPDCNGYSSLMKSLKKEEHLNVKTFIFSRDINTQQLI